MITKKEVTASSLEQLCCCAHTHRVRNTNNSMDVVFHNFKSMDDDAMLFCSLADAGGHKVFVLELPKHLVAIFWTPLDVPKIVANRMSVT